MSPEPLSELDVQWLDLRHAIEQKPKPLDFVLPGFKSNTIGALISPGATGKTMFALQAAVTVAGGPDLLNLSAMDKAWQRTTNGRVVFLTAEDPPDVLNKRFYEIGKYLSPDEKEAIFKNLLVAPLIGHGINIMELKWQHWINKITQNTRLVIIDTLRRFHQLDENTSGHMAELLAYMEKLCRVNSTAILFLHHTSKSGALNNSDSQQASRGSSVLTDNARFQINLIGMTSKQAEQYDIDSKNRKNFVRLSFPKINYSTPIKDFWFQRKDGGILSPTNLNRTIKKGQRGND